MRRLVIAVAVVLVGAVKVDAAYVWHDYGGSRYAITASTSTWASAEAEAIAAGGHLVTVNNTAENSWLATTFDNASGHEAWIGFTDQAEEGLWTWASGEGGWWRAGDPGSTSFASWASGQPDNYPHTLSGQDFGILMTASSSWPSGSWDDLQPLSRHGIIEVQPIPEPSTVIIWSLLGTFGVAFGWYRRRRTA